MTRQVIDPMLDTARWSAVTADGVTPSDKLSVRDDRASSGAGALVTARSGAVGHRLRRTITPIDISTCTEIRIGVRAEQRPTADGEWFPLELRFASPALPLTDPGNVWHRLLPVHPSGAWESVRMSIDDLSPAITRELTEVQLGCLATPFTVHLDGLIAVRPRTLADADRALVTALGGISVDGAPADVSVRAADEPSAGPPALDIRRTAVNPARHRAGEVTLVRDYTGGGHRLTEPGAPYDIEYAVRAIAATAQAEAALVEAVLDRLPPLGELRVDGDRLPVTQLPGIAHRDGAVLRYQIGVRAPARPGRPVVRATKLEITVDRLGGHPVTTRSTTWPVL